jgi:hypothetical protein
MNKMEWIYKKDKSISKGSDCAWIDKIDFAQSSTVSYVQKDLQVARIVASGRNGEYGLENISAKVLNPGKDTINGFNLAYEINDHFPPVKQFFDYKIIPNSDSVTVTFNTKADLSKYGIYKIVTYAFGNNDDYVYNDTLTASIENTRINETVGVYPNPFRDNFTVTVNSQAEDKLQISITNVTGIKLYDVEKSILSGNNSFTISNLKLAPSVYYLKISGTTINKIIPVLKLR